MVRAAVERCDLLASARSVSLVSELPATPVPVMMDRGKIIQVFCNLISNAIKFSPAGATVRVGARRTGDGAEAWVTDFGQGMHPADLAQLFRRSASGLHRGPHGEAGTGLGLAIVTAVLRLHHGTIRVTTEPGKGSTFSFTLPRRPPVLATPVTLSPGATGSSVGSRSRKRARDLHAK